MKIPVSLFWKTPASPASIRTQRTHIPVLLLAITLFGGLTSCQRASQAYFAPSSRPVIERVPLAERPAPAPAPALMASRNETIPVVTEPATPEAVAVPVAMPVAKQQPARSKKAKPAPPQCDQIVLRNGDLIDAKVKEVGVSEIKYKKCDRQDGPDYTISKRDVLSIRYSNGDVERFNTTSTAPSHSNSNRPSQSYNTPTNAADDGPRTDPFAIVAIATGGLAILTGYGAFLLGAAAIIFGALSLTRIRKEPQRFKGKGLAVAGMVAGLVSAAVTLLYILL